MAPAVVTEINGQRWAIRFTHAPQSRLTMCLVGPDVPPQAGPVMVTVGVSRVHPRDNYSKVIGRQVALGHALAPMVVFEEKPEPNPIDRETRRALWAAFWERFPR